MPDIISLPKISVSQIQPPITIFDTAAGDLTEITGQVELRTGSQTTTQPAWASCGVTVNSDCGCYPTPYREKFCHYEQNPIQPNWPEDLPGDLPLNLLFNGGNPQLQAQPKTYTPRACCQYHFRPLAQYLRLKRGECETGLTETTRQYLRAYANRLLIDQLMGSINGNPSIPMVANVVNPTDPDDGTPIKVSDCVGLTALQENHGNLNQLIAPMSAINSLLASNQISRTNEGQLVVTSSGTRIIADPAWKGQIGPPETGPWDGTSPFDPASELTEPEPGCVWMYMTGPIYVSQWEQPETGRPLNGSQDVLGNTDTALAELQTIAVFDPCDVTAVLIDVNKGIPCG